MSVPVFMIATPSGWLALDADQLQRALARGADLTPMNTAMTNGMTKPTTTDPDASELLTAKEAAALLRLPASTLYRQAKAGTLPAVKVGRFYRFRKADLYRTNAEKGDLSRTISEHMRRRPNGRSTGCRSVG